MMAVLDRFRLDGRTAVITGGSRGLGKDMALNLAKKGLDVIITYHSKSDEAAAVVQDIQNSGQKAAALQLSVGEVKSFGSFLTAVNETLKTVFQTDKIDFLINNAGMGHYAPFVSVAEADFDDVCNVHLKGPFFLTQILLPIMNDGGGIVNISSGLARFSFPGSSTYAAMKSAIETLTRYQAKELGDRRIRANVVAPGAIETDFGGGHVRDNPALNKQVASLTALGRVGLPDDVGGVVAFLCSDDAKWVNGQRIEVSGGTML